MSHGDQACEVPLPWVGLEEKEGWGCRWEELAYLGSTIKKVSSDLWGWQANLLFLAGSLRSDGREEAL